MITIAIKKYPEAYKAAQALHQRQQMPFPLNISRLLERIEAQKIYDISSASYNSSCALAENEMLYPKKAWTIYHESLNAYLIIWNKAQSSASIRYSVAHELGHILLHHERNWPTDRLLSKRHKENEADTFARCLLAPFDKIQQLCNNQPFNAQLVSNYFCIPYKAALKIRYDYEYWKWL